MGERRRVALGTVAIGGAALALRLANLNHTPYVDELNHLVAAASLLSEGAPLISEKFEYTRALLMTWMVAGSYLLFGEGLVAARVPALLAGTALVMAVFAWVRSAVGAWEGWAAGILLALAPQAIYHSQLARFYSFQALFVVGVAWVAWVLMREAGWVAGNSDRREGGVASSPRRTAVLVGLGALCAAGALHMQLSSIVGVGTVGVWLLAVIGVRGVVSSESKGRSRSLLAAAGVAVAGGAILLWFHGSGQLQTALSAFGQAGGEWAEPYSGSLRYYHYSMLSHYPLLWAPFPLIALVALVRRPGPVSLWLLIFGAIFGVHTLAAWKADRYIFYALPFFFMVAGIVIGPLVRWVGLEVAKGADRFMEGVRGIGRGGGAAGKGAGKAGVGSAPRWARITTGLTLVPVLLFAAWGNPAFSYTGRMVLGSDAGWPFEIKYRGEPDWGGVAEDLGDRIAEVEILISSTELKTLYFVGRNDLILSVNYLGRDGAGALRPPFTRNRKTDTPVIARPESLEEVIACHRSGLILVEDNHWGQRWSNPPELTATIERSAERIELSPGRRVHAFGWAHDDAREPAPERCEAVWRSLRADPAEIYHLGAQSHVTVSFEEPLYTMDSGAMGTLPLLREARDLFICNGIPFNHESPRRGKLS